MDFNINLVSFQIPITNFQLSYQLDFNYLDQTNDSALLQWPKLLKITIVSWRITSTLQNGQN